MTSKTENPSRKLILIDGNGLAYRSFYAVAPQKTASGFPTNAILGFTNLLLTVLLAEKPTHVAVAFDQGASTERVQKFQGYNVQREEMPEELAAQIPVIEDLVRECGLAACRVPGHEADDCIGTLARRARDEGFQVLVVSGDLDLLQLVDSRVRVQTTRRGIGDLVVYDEAGVRRRYNLDPCQLADLRALAGDSSQNIGGVPGIGEVTARKLLSQYRSLDDLLSSLDQLPAKWRNPLAENREDALEFRTRATIVTALPIDLEWDRCAFQGLSGGRLAGFLERLEAAADFEALLRRFGGSDPVGEPPILPAQPLAPEEARSALARAAEAPGPLAVAWLQAREAERGLSVARPGGEVFSVLLGEGPDELPAAEAWSLLEPALRDSGRRKFLHRFRDLEALRASTPSGVLDLALVSALLDPGERDHSLEAVARRHDRASVTTDELWGLESRPEPGSGAMARWMARRACSLLELGPILEERLERVGLASLYWSTELPLVRLLGSLEEGALALDSAAVADLGQAVEDQLEELRHEIHAEADRPFNLDCDKELGEFLFDSLGLLLPTRPKNGGAIGAEVLVSLVGQHPIAQTVRNYRELSEFKSHFVDGFLASGRVPEVLGGSLVNPAMEAEGRLQWLGLEASAGPVATLHQVLAVIDKLQCVPVRSRLWELVQRALVASAPDRRLLVLEYDQLEMRLLAHLSGDAALAGALRGEDLEVSLAGFLYGVDSPEVLPEMRRTAVLAALHRVGPRWLGRRLDLSDERAAERLKAFRTEFACRFPKAEAWFQARLADARNLEPLRTLAGRRRGLPEVHSRNHDIREAAERTARTGALDGSAADLLRANLVALAEALPEARFLVPVGNQLLLDVPGEGVEALAARAVEQMARVAGDLDLPVRWHAGGNWLEACAPEREAVPF